jgi:hypothetical protein
MRKPTLRTIALGAATLAVAVPTAALAAGEGKQLLAGKRNPGSSTYTTETQIIANNATYGTRQSNTKDGEGGGAIYGCRSAQGKEPCIRVNNLKGGRAFEFVTTGNQEAGRIEVGNPTGAPLTTNAKGVATGFNADQVDGREGTDLGLLRFANVAAAGQLGNQRGATAAALTNPATNTYTVTFNGDVSKCSHTATIVGSTAGNQSVAVAPGTDPKTVMVDLPDHPSARAPFNAQVMC